MTSLLTPEGQTVLGGPEAGDCWLDYQHPLYASMLRKWTRTRDVYTGECASAEKIKSYLIRKAQGEAAEAFAERVQLSPLPPLFGTIVDSLAGLVSSSDDRANRVYNDGDTTILGEPHDQETTIGRLWRNADGRGNGWLTVHKSLRTELIAVHYAWGLVDSIDGVPVVRYLSPEQVPNWIDTETGPTDVIVRETVDARRSVQERAARAQSVRWVRYLEEGWERWAKDEHGKAQLVEASAYHTDPALSGFYDASNRRTIPIFPVVVPLSRNIGWQTAERVLAYWNAKSSRDNLLRIANHPRANIVGDKEHFDAVIGAVREGVNALHSRASDPRDHSYITPPADAATIATAVLVDERTDIFVNAFREYGNAARQKTATEVVQDVAAGPGSFLQLLTAAEDGAENNALARVAQIVYPGPGNAKKWFVAKVERSTQFLPTDPDAEAEKLGLRLFGDKAVIPVGRQARVDGARQIAEYLGLNPQDEELEAEIELQAVMRVIDASTKLDVPASMRAQLVLRLAAAAGLADAEKVADLLDRDRAGYTDDLYAEAMALAEASDDAVKLAAQGLAAGGDGESGDDDDDEAAS